MAKNKFLYIIIFFTAAVYILMGIYADFGRLVSIMEEFRWDFFILLLAFTTISYVIRFIKWDFFLKSVDIRLNVRDNLFVFLSGFSMVMTPGKVGEVWKGWLIKDINGEKLNKTVPVVIMDRITDVMGLIFLSMLGIIYFMEGVYIIIVLLLLFSGFLIAVRSKTISGKIIMLLERRMGKYAENIKTMHATFEILMKPGALISMSFLSAFAWFFECLVMYFAILGFGQSISITLSTFIFSFASLAGAVSMVPGGLGVAEGTISGMLQYFGTAPAVSVAITIIVRSVTLWYGTIIGLSVYFIFNKKIKRYGDREMIKTNDIGEKCQKSQY
ncbi:MAG: lysylphosphatidylglycerol synthase transmembrane domain-containing protein [Candidatus Methanoperedens sp.]